MSFLVRDGRISGAFGKLLAGGEWNWKKVKVSDSDSEGKKGEGMITITEAPLHNTTQHDTIQTRFITRVRTRAIISKCSDRRC